MNKTEYWGKMESQHILGSMRMVNPKMKWLRAPRDFMKCNVDVSFYTSFNSVMYKR